MEYLDKINSPADVKKMDLAELQALSSDIRKALLFRLSRHGGHVGPNFGMVEATIALHYVFNVPTDKLVFDISHQSYVHKMLTGRREAFEDESKFDAITGFSEPSESPDDLFAIGHTSTSISLASGLVKARDLAGDKYNVIAVIGDGSLSGGEALEGLDFVGGEIHSNMIILVNDNGWSIAENHGGLYQSLRDLRHTMGKSENNIFKAMGLDYIYAGDGNDLATMIGTLTQVKDIDHPVVVHMVTQKGKWFDPAVEDEETWHYHGPFYPETGRSVVTGGENYSDITADFLLKKMEDDPMVTAITAGVPMVAGFHPAERAKAGRQFIDVGIAEEQAVAMASGMAKNGGKPVFFTHGTFVQRAYDQISQDLCINNNPATLLLGTPSVYGMNDVTHLGLFITPMLLTIPNMVVLAPTSVEEYLATLDWSLDQTEHPVSILMPSVGVIHDEGFISDDYNQINKYKVVKLGEKVAIIAAGDMYRLGSEVADKIETDMGFAPTLVNPRYLSGLDDELLNKLKANHELVITLEGNSLAGGFGAQVASFYGDSDVKVKNYGIAKGFYDGYDLTKLLQANHLTVEQIAGDVAEILNK